MLYIFLFAILISFVIGLAVWAIIEAVQHNKKKNKFVIGDCKNTRWGCCPDNLIPKYDPSGTNCVPLEKQNLNRKYISNKCFNPPHLSGLS
jgi:hypothetical protein